MSRRVQESGFTLIEVIVVLVISRLLARALGNTLIANEARESGRVIEHLRLVLEAAADRGNLRGQPVVIEILPNSYRAFRKDIDGHWLALEEPPLFRNQPLPASMRQTSLTISGQIQKDGRIEFGRISPSVELQFATARGPVSLIGTSMGKFEVHWLDTKAPTG